ncbi:MAG: hypothetical protein E1N59_2119 [Puniceicoccaceae bacterium 5H]|nr:MAG: hypothetical protein E1N59_2119 [Puniceicoccaceae bacterium 5H]
MSLRLFTRFSGWDDSDAVCDFDLVTDFVAIVSFVRTNDLQLRQFFESGSDRSEGAAVVGLAGAQTEPQQVVLIAAGGVDLGGQPTSRASQSLIATVFLGAPAA